jgi:hypothetical protein
MPYLAKIKRQKVPVEEIFIDPKEKIDPKEILPLDRYYAKYPNLYLWFSEGSDLQVFWRRKYGEFDIGDVNEVEEITIIRTKK